MSTFKNLDPTGLQYYSNKIKEKINEKLTLVSLTEAEYNELSEADKNKANTIYEIKDENESSGESVLVYQKRIIGSAEEVIEITQAEYNALPASEKEKAVFYYITDAVTPSPSVSGGGHTIVDEDGNPTTQRSNLMFVNAEVLDNAPNDTTIVEVNTNNALVRVLLSDQAYDGKLVTLTQDVLTFSSTLTNGEAVIKVPYTGIYDLVVDETSFGTINIVSLNKLYKKDLNTKYFGFHQDFSNLSPNPDGTGTITYLSGMENASFSPMMTNTGTGTETPGDWEEFLYDILNNHPAMVKTDGTLDYWLDDDDYTKKAEDGTASDYNNTSYSGGAFAWINKFWTKETYSSDGNSRDVIFAFGAKPDDESFLPIGFIEGSSNTELEGIWLPMGYMDSSSRTLVAGTTPIASNTCDQEWTKIQSFSSRARFLGGPIINVLRDLEYMLYRSTDIQTYGGHGRCNAGNNAVIANNVVPNGVVKGFYGTSNKTTLNKAFHSQVLFSYQQWLRDPYTLEISNKLYVSPNYIYDLSGGSYINTGIAPGNSGAWWYPAHLINPTPSFGSVPKSENTVSTSTGLCDGLYTNSSGTRVALRLGTCVHDLIDGPSTLSLSDEASNSGWSVGVGVILLPTEGYAP